jgi:hypothetical protein
MDFAARRDAIAINPTRPHERFTVTRLQNEVL